MKYGQTARKARHSCGRRAVIAGLGYSSLGNTVIWTHADPLTGSKQEVTKTGAILDTPKSREEYEPLGQSVRPRAPLFLDPPGQGPSPIINDAGFPEWQCALPTQLIPSACGLKILASERFVLGIASERTTGNTSKITDSAISDLALFSASDEAMSQTLTSSSKQTQDKDKGKPKKRRAKKAEKPANVVAEVQSERAADEPITTVPGFVDASLPGQQQTQITPRVAMTPEEIQVFRDKIPGALTDKCADFINKLVRAQTNNNSFDAKTDLLKEFDRVKNSAPDYGFFWGGLFGKAGGLAGKGNVGRNDAEIRLGRRDPSIVSLIHELIHVAARADDVLLSQTVKDLNITVYLRSGKIADYPTDKDNINLQFSGYWGQALINNCEK